jgi:hypothetical protein
MGTRFGPGLLAVARRALREELLPKLPEDSRYAGLMVANAMAIAAREAEAGDGPARAELAGLAALLGEPEGTGPLAEELRRLNRELVRRIRAGDVRPGSSAHGALRRHLWQSALARVRVSNPKYLERLPPT